MTVISMIAGEGMLTHQRMKTIQGPNPLGIQPKAQMKVIARGIVEGVVITDTDEETDTIHLARIVIQTSIRKSLLKILGSGKIAVGIRIVGRPTMEVEAEVSRQGPLTRVIANTNGRVTKCPSMFQTPTPIKMKSDDRGPNRA